MSLQKLDKDAQKLADARREVAYQFERVQKSLDRELTWFPKGEKWLLPLTAFAVGLALTRKGRKPGA